MRRNVLMGAALALVVAGGVFYWTTRELATVESVLARLPVEDAAVLSVDFAALRRGGMLELLGGPVVDEEPEYKTFVAKTGFDYRKDLDHAFVSFHPAGTYFLARGRFDWDRLSAYAREQGGGCYEDVCRMTGSEPSRRISYFLVQRDLIAMAVSPDESAATRMESPAWRSRQIAAPDAPVWLRLPTAKLRNAEAFPTGTQLFAKAMQGAESATLSIAPKGKALEARLEVECRGAREAEVMTAQFEKMTSVLRSLIEKEKAAPAPGDLAVVLTAGVFRQEEARVVGLWPIEQVFLEKLAGK